MPAVSGEEKYPTVPRAIAGSETSFSQSQFEGNP
jgi:hypothetical protein